MLLRSLSYMVCIKILLTFMKPIFDDQVMDGDDIGVSDNEPMGRQSGAECG